MACITIANGLQDQNASKLAWLFIMLGEMSQMGRSETGSLPWRSDSCNNKTSRPIKSSSVVVSYHCAIVVDRSFVKVDPFLATTHLSMDYLHGQCREKSISRDISRAGIKREGKGARNSATICPVELSTPVSLAAQHFLSSRFSSRFNTSSTANLSLYSRT